MMGAFLDCLPGFDWEKWRALLISNNLPPCCEECGLDWCQYRRRVEVVQEDWSEIVREHPAYAVMTLDCKNGHHHRWINYPNGERMPDHIAAPILAREEQEEADERR